MVHAQKPEDRDDDVIFEDTEVSGTEKSNAAKLKELREKLKACQKERQEYLDGWQRAKADHLNSKRRAEEERTRHGERSLAHVIESLLPLCDSFDQALALDPEKADANAWHAGLIQVSTQLQSVLKTHGVSVIAPLGKLFNPYEHEALSEAPTGDKQKDHTVVSVLQNGYKIGDQLIRPAKVVVATYTEQA